jgi:hypothetical protein
MSSLCAVGYGATIIDALIDGNAKATAAAAARLEHLMNSRKRQRTPFKPRRLRYGTRTLLGVLFAIALALASVERWVVRPYREQQKAIAVLDACNGTYTQEVQVPTWLRWVVPDSCFLRVVGVDLRGRRITDRTLQGLSGLTRLRQLDVQDTVISDSGLEYVGRMQELNLAYTRVTDAGLAHLARLGQLQKLHVRGTAVRLSSAVALFERRYPSDKRRAVLAAVEAVGGRVETVQSGIRRINLNRCRVGNAGLAHLAQFPELERLYLVGTLIRGGGPEELGQLRNLRALNVSRTPFTDAGLARLRSMPHLESLGLGATLATDLGLVHLKRLDALKELELYYTSVTDAGLAPLHGLATLESVNLVGTRVTDEGIGELRAALPNARIIH